MLNRIILMGRLTRDPELRQTQSGASVANFSLAVDRDLKDKQTGEKTTDFIDIVAWRSSAEFVSRYFAKGRIAVVEGRLQLRDLDGQRRQQAPHRRSTGRACLLRRLQAGRGRRCGIRRSLYTAPGGTGVWWGGVRRADG